VPPDELQPANGLRSTAMSAGEIGGPLAAGVLVAAAGAGSAIAVDAATFAISAVFLARLRLQARAARAPSPFLTDLRDGWQAFRERTWVWTVVAYFTLANLLWGAWSALGPVVAERDLGGAEAWGAVLAAVGVGALAGSLWAARARPRRPLVVVALSELVFALPLAFLAAGAWLPLLALAALLSGAAMMYGNAVWMATLQRHIPDESLSRVSSYDWFGSLAFYPLGLAIWGPLASTIGIDTALWLAFALMCAAGLTLAALPDIRRMQGAQPRGQRVLT
jgi:predicted MFS family arabinose efflux permease